MFWFLWTFCGASLWLIGAIHAYESATLSLAGGGKGLGLVFYLYLGTPIYLLVFALLTAGVWLARWSMHQQKTNPKYKTYE